MTVPEQAEWLLVKRGLYYRPNDCGYTGIRDEAGRYSETDAYSRASNGVTMIRADLAPEFSEKCFPDLALKHVIKQRDDLRAQPPMGVQQTEVCGACGQPEAYERLNVLEDLMSCALAHLEGDPEYRNKAVILDDLRAYRDARKAGRAILSPGAASPQPREGEK